VADHDAEAVVVRLTRDEALVLSDWLRRCEEEDALADVTSDPAEVIALDALSALLEPELVELFDPNYLELVEAARQRLRSSSD
jgi:hypothetical protein